MPPSVIALPVVWGRGRRAAGVALALLAALLISVLQAGVALAHAELVGSEPHDGAVLESTPSTIQLYFSEPIERDFFSIEVYNANRQRVDRGGARIPPDNAQSLVTALPELRPGIYTVVWRVLSIDGHVVRGVFAFSVGVAGVAAGTA
ncbi:MAG TPA: copper resistance protein CopC, partial [Chloroflexota bacterium]|nr:copper resistance protein CopC [Chloroflexota bacterium]